MSDEFDLAALLQRMEGERGPEWFLGLHETSKQNSDAFLWCLRAAYNFALSRLSQPGEHELEQVVLELADFLDVLAQGVAG